LIPVVILLIAAIGAALLGNGKWENFATGLLVLIVAQLPFWPLLSKLGKQNKPTSTGFQTSFHLQHDRGDKGNPKPGKK